ncbi:MAG: phage antirepressor [Oscillospiraceae bacterium]|nr:phage antirepressor [Oscillospiraceae bacterium]
MSELQVFNFEGSNVRLIEQDGEPWWVLKDVCAVLGLSNARMIAGRLDEDDVNQAYVTDSLGRQQQTNIVNESGLYNVILRSDKPEAKRFKRWVTREVLPQIRRTGGYIPVAEDEPDEVIMARALLIMQKTIEAKDRLIGELQPKADFADAVAASPDCVSFGEMAKILRQNGLPYGRTRMCEALRQDGFLIKQQCADYNTPTQLAMERDVFYHSKHVKETPGGFLATTNVTRVTGLGQQVLLRHFRRKQENAGGYVA